MKNFLVQVTDLANKNDQTKTTSLMETLMQANDSFEEDVLANTDSLMKFILTASDSEITEKVNEQIQRINRTEKEDRMNYLYRVIPEAVENFSYDFDMDKLFLLSAYRAAKILEEAGPTEELNKIITLIFNRSIQVIKNRTTVTLKEKDEKGNPKQITRKEIEKLRSNITQDGYYVSEKEKDRIRKEIFYRRENTSKFKGTRCRKGEST